MLTTSIFLTFHLLRIALLLLQDSYSFHSTLQTVGESHPRCSAVICVTNSQKHPLPKSLSEIICEVISSSGRYLVSNKMKHAYVPALPVLAPYPSRPCESVQTFYGYTIGFTTGHLCQRWGIRFKFSVNASLQQRLPDKLCTWLPSRQTISYQT